MSFPDFTSKTWKVTETDSGSLIQKDYIVRFSGTEPDVDIEVKDSTGSTVLAAKGTYRGGSNSIEMGKSKIKLRIKCQDLVGGGSWTAEDTSGSGGDGD